MPLGFRHCFSAIVWCGTEEKGNLEVLYIVNLNRENTPLTPPQGCSLSGQTCVVLPPRERLRDFALVPRMDKKVTSPATRSGNGTPVACCLSSIPATGGTALIQNPSSQKTCDVVRDYSSAASPRRRRPEQGTGIVMSTLGNPASQCPPVGVVSMCFSRPSRHDIIV